MHAVASLTFLAGLAAAANHRVMVGPNGGLDFSPATITAAQGDTVEFVWDGDSHAVTHGDPNNGCAPISSSAFNSGDISDGSWTITINSTDPIYYYCGVGRHCQLGMVGGINLPSEAAFNSYRERSASASTNVLPDTIQGGSTGGPSSSSSSSASSSSSSASSSSSSSMSMASSSQSSMSTTASSSSSSGSAAGVSTTPTGGAPMATQFVGVAAALPFALAALL